MLFDGVTVHEHTAVEHQHHQKSDGDGGKGASSNVHSHDLAVQPDVGNGSLATIAATTAADGRNGVDCGTSVLSGLIKLNRLPHEQLFGLFHIGARVSLHSPCPVEIMGAEW